MLICFMLVDTTNRYEQRNRDNNPWTPILMGMIIFLGAKMYVYYARSINRFLKNLT